jgi:hypothetical protein
MNQLLDPPSSHHLSEGLRLLCASFIEPCLFQGKPVSNRSRSNRKQPNKMAWGWQVPSSTQQLRTQQH